MAGSTVTIPRRAAAFPDWRPAIIGNCHRLLVCRFNMTLITSALQVDPLPCSMWNSGLLEYPVEVDVVGGQNNRSGAAETWFDNNEFDGRYIMPLMQMYVLDLLVGVYIPINVQTTIKQLPLATSSFFEYNNNIYVPGCAPSIRMRPLAAATTSICPVAIRFSMECASRG